MSKHVIGAFGVSCMLLSGCGGGGGSGTGSGSDPMGGEVGAIDPADVVTTSRRGFAVAGETLSNVPDNTEFDVEVRRIDGAGSVAASDGTLTVLAPINSTINSPRDLFIVSPEVVTSITDGQNQLTGRNASLSPYNGLENVNAFRIIYTDEANDQVIDHGVFGTTSDPAELQRLAGSAQYDTTVFMTMRETDASGADVQVFESNGIANVVMTADFDDETIGGLMTYTNVNGPESDNLRGSQILLQGDLSSGNVFAGSLALPSSGSGTALDEVSGTFDGAFYGPDGSEIGGLMEGTMGTSATDNTITFVGAFTGDQ